MNKPWHHRWSMPKPQATISQEPQAMQCSLCGPKYQSLALKLLQPHNLRPIKFSQNAFQMHDLPFFCAQDIPAKSFARYIRETLEHIWNKPNLKIYVNTGCVSGLILCSQFRVKKIVAHQELFCFTKYFLFLGDEC